jgi:hypothetical protein
MLGVLAGCSDGPVQPGLPQVEAVVAGGNGQFGTVGQLLPTRLQVVVRATSTGAPQENVAVLWEVVGGSAEITTAVATLTDETGSAFATVRLGATAGDVRIHATVTAQETATALFELFAIDPPELDGLSADLALAGDTIVLTGANFSALVDQNVVLFSGIRGLVTAATATQLSVEVPPCLPTKSVEVVVQLGVVASEPQALGVTATGQAISLDPGEVIDVADPEGLTCLRLAGGIDMSYLTIVYSASEIAAAQHGFELTGLFGSAAAASPVPERASPSLAPQGSVPTRSWLATQGAWEAELRSLEASAVRNRAGSLVALSPGLAAAKVVPSVGDRRTFSVFNGQGGFDQVEAVAEFVGEQAVLFIDETAPAGGLSQADLAAFSDRFDEVIYPTISGAFGEVPDLDGNGRVVIVFTPTVNRLTPRGSSGFAGGFFFGIDLLPEREGSNEAEAFYMLVPDPAGEFSDARSTSKVLEVTPAILAHEFQHMVHFNERVLKLDAEAPEALWLSEGLAQMAEELVAREYEETGDNEAADLFRVGNRERARRYLSNPSAASLIVAAGQGSLEERGAGWLHVLYLTAQNGESVLGLMTRTTRTGIDNVTDRIGRSWSDLLSDWWAGIFLDGSVTTPSLSYPGLDLRTLLGSASFALAPEQMSGTDFMRAGSLWSSSAEYYIVVPSLQGSVAIRLGGEAGGSSSAGAALRMRVIRVS